MILTTRAGIHKGQRRTTETAPRRVETLYSVHLSWLIALVAWDHDQTLCEVRLGRRRKRPGEASGFFSASSIGELDRALDREDRGDEDTVELKRLEMREARPELTPCRRALSGCELDSLPEFKGSSEVKRGGVGGATGTAAAGAAVVPVPTRRPAGADDV